MENYPMLTAILTAVGLLASVAFGLISAKQARKRQRLREEIEAEYAHLPKGDRLIKVAQAMDAAKKLNV